MLVARKRMGIQNNRMRIIFEVSRYSLPKIIGIINGVLKKKTTRINGAAGAGKTSLAMGKKGVQISLYPPLI